MPIETTSQILRDGARNAAMQFTGYSSDGSGEANEAKVDVSAFATPCRAVAVTKIEWTVSGDGAIKLLWGGNAAHEDFVILSGQGCLDYDMEGGAQNQNPDPSGDILLSTVDFGIGSGYTLKLTMNKKF